MRKIDQLLSEYGESHQNATNKTIHWICVPLIFFSIVGLVWSIPSGLLKTIVYDSPWVNWATLSLSLALIYYMRLSFPLFLGMVFIVAIFTSLCYTLSQWNGLPLWALSLAIFVAAWVGQFYGHKIEGKKPSFLKDLQFLLIGPAWLMHFIFKKMSIKY